MDEEKPQVEQAIEHEVKEVRPPGHELLERLAKHHEHMLSGVKSYLPAMSDHEKNCKCFKKYAVKCHKAMTDLANQTGYPVKMAELGDELEDKDSGEESGDLPLDTLEQEENLSDDEAKMFLAKIAELEAVDKEEMALIAALRVR